MAEIKLEVILERTSEGVFHLRVQVPKWLKDAVGQDGMYISVDVAGFGNYSQWDETPLYISVEKRKNDEAIDE